MENIVLKKKEGKIEVMNMSPSITNEMNSETTIHLCWGNCSEAFCKNADINKCPKVKDRRKKTLDKYEFITDGIQTLDDAGKVEHFIVTGCNKYEPVGEKKLTKEQAISAKEAKAGLMTYYFDAETLEEAQVSQYMQMIRGTLVNVEGKTLPAKTMVNKILQRSDAEALLKEVVEYLGRNPKANEEALRYASKKLRELREARHEKEREHEMTIKVLTKKAKEEGKIK